MTKQLKAISKYTAKGFALEYTDKDTGAVYLRLTSLGLEISKTGATRFY